jgi:hypothetical protein
MLLENGDYYWQGNEEECNDCHEKYPMMWMIMCDFGIIRCFDCWQKNEEYERKKI